MTERQQWGSKLGFILAASGSAIGLGNIVFFSANAYKFGAGAFYLPYLFALFVVGVPVMIVEFGIGRLTNKSLPLALGKLAGRGGEAIGWFGVVNAFVITMYYTTILSWVAGSWWSAVAGSLWQATVETPRFAMEELANPTGSFFNMLSSWWNVVFVVFVWTLNLLAVGRGAKSIERAVKVMVPFIWLVMIAFCAYGLSQPGGVHGAVLLLNPNFDVLAEPEVWTGAFSQVFFTLTLGFGVMTAYASYLPARTDHTGNAIVVSMMNCLFELIAGVAIFSLLFVYAIAPKDSTLSMMFFIIPEAISEFPTGVKLAGAGFFTLLLLAGLSSSISLLEAALSGLSDKFGLPRWKGIALIAPVGFVGSVSFALPHVVDPELAAVGTAGLALLDFADHYAFGYGLMITGLLECLVVGWWVGPGRLRDALNEHSGIQLPAFFDVVVRWVIPAILIVVLASSVLSDFGVIGNNERGPYGHDYPIGKLGVMASLMPLIWLAFTVGVSVLLTTMSRRERP